MESSSVASSYVIRPAHPRDAAALVALAEEVVAEPEGWLVSDGGWRTVTDERRYLRAIRRYSDAAVFVAEGEGGIVGRLSLGREGYRKEHYRRGRDFVDAILMAYDVH
jgi:RimJ/RimL family protein N-acetyltransferase